MSNITCLCTDPLQSPANEKCSAPDFGNQIVMIIVQKMTGVSFGTAGGSVYDINTEADWQTLINSDGDDRLAIFKNLSNGVMPMTDPNIEEGNAVPNGGVDVIDQPRNIEAEIKYFSASDLSKLDQIACWDQARVWFVTNRNWVWGDSASTQDGLNNVSIIKKSLGMDGIGTKPRVGLRAAWNNTCEPKPIAQLTFIQSLEGSNISGSQL